MDDAGPLARCLCAEDESVLDGVKDEVAQALREDLSDGVEDTQRLQQITRRVMGAWISRKLRRRPLSMSYPSGQRDNAVAWITE